MGQPDLEDGGLIEAVDRGRGKRHTKEAYEEMVRERWEEDAELMRLQMEAVEGKFAHGMETPRLGPKWATATEEQKERVRKAREEGGTVTTCGEECFGGRGMVPPGDTRLFCNEKAVCCQHFEPMKESLRAEGMDYIVNTNNMAEDLEKVPEYWDKSITDVMRAGGRIYYTGNNRGRAQDFKNSETILERPELTKKAFVKA